MEQPANKISPELRSAIGFSAVQQVAIVLTCAFLQDGGLRLRASLLALGAFWAMTMFIIFLRGSKPIKIDFIFVRWSYPLIWLTAVVISSGMSKMRVT